MSFPTHQFRLMPSMLALLALGVAGTCVPVHAAAAGDGDVKLEAIVTGTGIRPPPSSIKREGSMVETIYVSGERVRVDFDAGTHLRGHILRNGDQAWLLRPPSHRALPARGVRIGSPVRMDTDKPCFDLGFSCQRVDDRLIAGRRANGWRYRHAGRHGPQGTDSGTFWIDAGTGIVLAFDGRDLARHDYRMETVSVHFGKLPDILFRLPDSDAAADPGD
jgi:hypothetical protein